jgi:hypothetical protein
LLHPKKVGYLPVDGTEKFKLTNEIKIAIPLLVNIDIEGKEITADALLTQHKIADYLVRERKAYCHFTVKIISTVFTKILPFTLKSGENQIL